MRCGCCNLSRAAAGTSRLERNAKLLYSTIGAWRFNLLAGALRPRVYQCIISLIMIRPVWYGKSQMLAAGGRRPYQAIKLEL
jgi:hypothetical protein